MVDRTILITGSSGTVGTALAERLLGEGYTVHGTDIQPNRWSKAVDERTVVTDLREPTATEKLPDDIDIVVHLAAHARVHKLVKNPKLAQENFDMTFNALEYARTRDASGFILGSSREVYGNNGKIVHHEEDTYVDECESPYTASKIGSEAMVKSYGNCYDLDSCILRFSNVYGKYDASDRVIPLFISLSNKNQELVVYGDNKILDFTYIDDCISGIYRTIDDFGKAKNSTFNIASGKGRSLVELAKLIVEMTDADSKIKIQDNRTGEVNKYVGDISRAEKILDYTPEYSLTEGIKKTVKWYDKNQRVQQEVLDDSTD